MNTKVYLTDKEFGEVVDELERVESVDVSILYGRIEGFDSSELAEMLLNNFDGIESVLFVPSDAPLDAPPAKLESKVNVTNVVEYLRRKLGERKAVGIYDSYETDYLILK